MRRGVGLAGFLWLAACVDSAPAVDAAGVVDAVAEVAAPALDADAVVQTDTGAMICTGLCPVGWHCAAPATPDSNATCVADWQCRPCGSDAACQGNGDPGNRCVRVPYSATAQATTPGAFCLAACQADGSCDPGYACEKVTPAFGGPAVKQCVPQTGQCHCQAGWAAAGLATDCSRTDGGLTCFGQQACAFNGAGTAILTPCSAGVPTSYYADSDGDGFGTSVVQTACSGAGTSAAKTGDCNDASPTVHPGAKEICNAVDDNCDGTTDVGTCDDGDWCTHDVCDGAAAKCANLPWGATLCDDGNDCTVDLCSAATCVHASVAGTCDMTGCTSGVCDGAGKCLVTTFADGTACDTCGPQVCGAGVCKPWVWSVWGGDQVSLLLPAGQMVLADVSNGEYTKGFGVHVIDGAGETLAQAWHYSYSFADGGGMANSRAAVLSGGGAILVGSVPPDRWVVRVTPTGGIQESLSPPWNFGAHSVMAGLNDQFLLAGEGKLPLTGATGAALSSNGCISLRNSDFSEVWSVVLGKDATAGQDDGFQTARKTPSGWLVGGKTAVSDGTSRPWLVWLSDAGVLTQEWVGMPNDAFYGVDRISPAKSGWLVRGTDGWTTQYWQANDDGTVVNLPASATDAVAPTCADAYACDTFMLGGVAKQGAPVLIRVAPNGEWRWQAAWPAGVWDRVDWLQPGGDNMLYAGMNLLATFDVIGCDEDCGFPFGYPGCCTYEAWAPGVQRLDAFGNTACAATSGCAGRPMSDCDDKDPCTADGCYAGLCTHKPWPAGTPCPGGVCQPGKCAAVP